MQNTINNEFKYPLHLSRTFSCTSCTCTIHVQAACLNFTYLTTTVVKHKHRNKENDSKVAHLLTKHLRRTTFG